MQPWDWAVVIAAVAAVGGFVRVLLSGDDERHEEEDARAFFDRNGHGPDEDPAAATEQWARRD